MHSSSLTGRFERGYTIIELVLVIVILGIIGTVAGPRFFETSVYDERAYYDELAGALRYAQKVAVASGCNVRVAVTASSYDLAQQAALSGHCNPLDASYPVLVLLPSGEAVTGSAPAGISTSPAVNIVFTALGQTTLGSDQVLTVGSRSLTVYAESGLVVTP